MEYRYYPPEVREEAKKWPMPIETVASIMTEFEDDDLRQAVLKAEAFGDWPVRHIAAIEQRGRRDERFARIASGEVSRELQSHWRDSIPRGKYHQ